METTIFDVNRAILYDKPEPHPTTIAQTISLKQAFADNIVQAKTHLLAAHIADTDVVIPLLPMVYHKVAQGTINDTDWVISFCVLCNSGGVFSPLLDGRKLTFAAQGFYNGMAIIADQETTSYWNHITGICIHGELTGQAMTRMGNLQQITVEKALNSLPDTVIAVPDVNELAQETAERWNSVYRQPQTPEWSEGLQNTLTGDDTRLPRYDMGIGVWIGEQARYYSVLKLNAHDNVIIDEIANQRIVVYVDLESGLPGAFVTDATSATRIGNSIRLDNGQTFDNGILTANQQRIIPKLPNQRAIRWYGFAFLFPDCEIWEG